MESTPQHPVNLKHRLTGAAALVLIAVIVIPWFLGGSNSPPRSRTVTPPVVQPDSEFVATLGQSNATSEASALSIEPTAAQGEVPSQSATPAMTSQEASPEPKGTDSAISEGVVRPEWGVRLGPYETSDDAEKLELQLRENGVLAERELFSLNGASAWRIVLGPFQSEEQAEGERVKAVLSTGAPAEVYMIDSDL